MRTRRPLLKLKAPRKAAGGEGHLLEVEVRTLDAASTAASPGMRSGRRARSRECSRRPWKVMTDVLAE